MASDHVYGFTGDPPPPHFNLARYCLENAAESFPDKAALKVFGGSGGIDLLHSWTFAELDEGVRRIIGALPRHGLTQGDRLLIRLDNCAEYALLFFAALGAGLVPIPASSQLTEAEVRFFLNDSGAAGIAVSPDMDLSDLAVSLVRLTRDEIHRMATEGPLGDYADTQADDPAYLVYTSGTTSHPKGVLHAHRAAWGRRPMYRDWYDIHADDVMLHAGAFNWTYTLGVGLTDPWANGATAVVYTGPKDVTVWPQLAEQAEATVFAAVPTVYRQMLKYCDLQPETLSTLRHGLTAGESLAPAIANEWYRRTGLQLYEAFGMSEISTYISTPPGTPPRSGSPGRAQSGRSVEVLPDEGGTDPLPRGETGIISVHRSDPGLMLGYWNRPEEEADMIRGDWFVTGDLAWIDEDGYFWPVGRADNMMNAMGYRVSPVEVEAVLSACPGVAEAAVAECEVRENVHIICAFVALGDTGNSPVTAADILAHARQSLAAYKVPRDVVFVDSLPRTANGKIKHRELRDRYSVAGG